MNEKIYHVSYNYSNRGGHGFGQCKLVRQTKIKTYKDILDITKGIEEENGFDGVVITSWNQLEG